MGIVLETGSAESTLDDKGRVNIPKNFREHFQGELIITKGVEPCAMVLKPEVWERVKQVEKSEELTYSEREALKRRLYNHVDVVEIDNVGRITIPPIIRKYAKLTRNCIVIRDEDRLLIWDSDVYNAYEEENDPIARAAMNKLGSQDIFRTKQD